MSFNLFGISVNLTISEIATGLTAFVSLLWAYKNKLPKWAREWLGKVGIDRVNQAIQYAASLATMTPEQRRVEAVTYLKKLFQDEFGYPLPDAAANWLVEYGYNIYKRAKK